MIFDNLMQSRNSLENPSTSLSDPAGWLYDVFGGAPVKSGVSVNEKQALKYTAVFSCVRVLSETLAHLPLNVHLRTDKGSDIARAHPLQTLLHDAPNDEMTSFVWREALQGHVSTWGNGYSYIERNGLGRPVSLVPLLPDVTWAERKNGRKQIVTIINGKEIVLDARDVLHIPGLGFDGLSGYSPIKMAREAIGLGIAATEFGAKFFGGGAALSGVLEHPGKLKDAGRVREHFGNVYGGLNNSFKTAVLEEGMKYNRIGIPPEDAQFLETRKYQRTEIASIYRMPLHLIGDLENATFSNIEQQDIGFLKHTMLPWFVRWEQELNRKLLTAEERTKYFIKFNVSGMLRGDQKSRYDAYHLAITDGWMSRNEARGFEDMNQEDGLDEFLTQMNMANVGEEPADDDNDEARRYDLSPIINSFAERLLSCESKSIAKLSKQAENLQQFAPLFDGFYDGHENFIRKTLAPIEVAVNKAGLVDAFIKQHKRQQFERTAECNDIGQVVDTLDGRTVEDISTVIMTLIGDE